MKIDDVVEAVEARFKVGPAGGSSRGPNGEPYVRFGCGGLWPELQPRPKHDVTSESELAEALLVHILDYAVRTGGDTVSWRIKPQLDEQKTRGNVRRDLYCRLLVYKSSDDPYQDFVPATDCA